MQLCWQSPLMEVGCVPAGGTVLSAQLCCCLRQQELIFQKHSSVGTSSRAVAHVTAWLEFVISSMRSSLAQPTVLALCGLVLCWTRADTEVCQVLISAEFEQNNVREGSLSLSPSPSSLADTSYHLQCLKKSYSEFSVCR